MRLLVRLFVVLLSLLWPVATATGAIASGEAYQSSYTYSAPLVSAAHTYDHIERGPPQPSAPPQLLAVDLGSRSPLAQSDGTVAHTYDTHATSPQHGSSDDGCIAGPAGAPVTTTGDALLVDVEPTLLQASRVAANAGTKLGWSTGDDIYSLTKAGNTPAWSTVRGRFWKNEAANPQIDSWSASNVDRMKRGLAPQRYNRDKGGLESMELSHEPIPYRDGGTSVIPRWPQDHANVDPFRFPGY